MWREERWVYGPEYKGESKVPTFQRELRREEMGQLPTWQGFLREVAC